MFKIVRWLLWVLVFLMLMSLLDQALVRVPLRVPVLQEFQVFYVDFRTRLLGLAGGETPAATVDRVIERSDPAAPKGSRDETATPRYLYVDETGALHFAETLDAVPPQFRSEAQRMED